MSLNKLGNSFLTRFKRLGELSDLEDAIPTQREAVYLSPHGHPDKPGYLINLGSSLLVHFRHLRELSNLEGTISAQREVVHLSPCGHPDEPKCLGGFGNSFTTSFERLEELSDLEDAISTQREAVHLSLQGHPDQPAYLHNLSTSLAAHLEELSDLKDAISTQKEAVHLIPHNHPQKPGYLARLGNSFQTRFKRSGELNDFEEPISAQREVVHLSPRDHPDKSGPQYLVPWLFCPSLATLVPSLGAVAIPSGDLRLLAVCQPDSDGQQPLPGVITELEYVQDMIERFPSAQTFLVESSVGTVEEVLQPMKESDWVHFTCHGAQDGGGGEETVQRGDPHSGGNAFCRLRRRHWLDVVNQR